MLKKLFLSVSNSGVGENKNIFFTDKLIVRNHLALICAFFSSIYLIYFLINGLVVGAVCISISILLFISSIVCNYFYYYNISKAIIILVTNFSVLFTSILFGFNSGFHLYLLTAPLITFMLFESKQRLIIFLSILSYCINFFLLLLLYKHNEVMSSFLHKDNGNHMYLINFTFTIFIIIILILYYSYNNLKVNTLLIQKNEALVSQQQNLKHEIDVRKKTEEKLVSLLADKSLLLSEINHRVKNNLAVVSGLLELENTFIKDDVSAKVIKDYKNRIKAIALLHEQFYNEENTGLINIKEFLNSLCQNIKKSYSVNVENLQFNYDVDSIDLKIDFALPLSLMLNELIVDSIKYSVLNSESGNINIIINKNKNKINISYKDNFTRNTQYKATYKNSYAYILIDSLSLQLDGVSVFDISEGMNFTITFNYD